MRVVFSELNEEVIHFSKIENVTDFYIFAVNNNNEITYLEGYENDRLISEKYIGGMLAEYVTTTHRGVEYWMKSKKEVHVFEKRDEYKKALINKIKELY